MSAHENNTEAAIENRFSKIALLVIAVNHSFLSAYPVQGRSLSIIIGQCAAVLTDNHSHLGPI